MVYKVQCEQVTEVHSRYYWCSDAQATDDTMWECKIQRQCKQLSVVLSRYMVQVWRKYRCITNRIHSQPKSKFAIKAFSLRKRIWSSFSPERLARWSVATRPPYEKSLSTFVELGGGVRCFLATLMKAFLRLSLGEVVFSYSCQNLRDLTLFPSISFKVQPQALELFQWQLQIGVNGWGDAGGGILRERWKFWTSEAPLINMHLYMSLPFPTNALPQTVQDAGTSILISAVVLSFSIVVDS